MTAAHPQAPPDEREVGIPLGDRIHRGTLRMPEQAKGFVLFAHGSGSSRFSPRNTLVARVLMQAGFASLLFDLLTEGEDRVVDARFDIPLLAKRLAGATEWSAAQPELARLPLGYFGASTGAAAALVAATRVRGVQAVVSRGGRPDLAMDDLPRVTAPTLLIVGGFDDAVIELNRHAAARMQVEHELVIVPGASHLFEEAGTLEQAAGLAARWFARHLHPMPRTSPP